MDIQKVQKSKMTKPTKGKGKKNSAKSKSKLQSPDDNDSGTAVPTNEEVIDNNVTVDPAPVPVPVASIVSASAMGSASTSFPSTCPSQMSTFQLVYNRNTLLAGMDLLTKYTSKKMNAQELETELGLKDKMKKKKKGNTVTSDRSTRSTNSSQNSQSQEEVTQPKPFQLPQWEREGKKATKRKLKNGNGMESPMESQEASLGNHEDEAPPVNQGGQGFFQELIGRMNVNDLDLDTMIKMKLTSTSLIGSQIQQHDEKLEQIRVHQEKIEGLSIRRLTKQFKKVTPQLQAIFDDELESERHQLFMKRERFQLKEMNVSVPFSSDHGAALFSLLFDLFVPDEEERPKWTEYLNYVMLPESFIRIYSRVNKISYNGASIQMRFGAIYDGPLIQ